MHPVLFICAWSLTYFFLSCGNISGQACLHAHTFRRNGRSLASVQAHTLSRNVRASASVIILSRTFVCLFVHACDSASIHGCASAIICACGGCSAFLYISLSNTLLWGDLGHVYSTDRVYILVSLGIPCALSQNIRGVSPCSGLVKKYAYISSVEHYFS